MFLSAYCGSLELPYEMDVQEELLEDLVVEEHVFHEDHDDYIPYDNGYEDAVYDEANRRLLKQKIEDIAFTGGFTGVCIIALVCAMLVLSPIVRVVYGWWEDARERERMKEQRLEEIGNFYSVNEWEQDEQGNWSYSGYFGEYATYDTSTPDITIGTPGPKSMTVNLVSVDPGLQVKLTVRGRRSDRDRMSSDIACGETFTTVAGDRYTIKVERLSGTGFFTFEVLFEE